MKLVDASRILLTRGWLAEQESAFQEALLAKGALKEVAAGKDVFRIGDVGGGIYGIVRGSFGVYVPWPDQETRLADILRTGKWFGYGPALTRRRRTLMFRSLEQSLVFHVTLGGLDRLIASNPGYFRNLAKVSEFGMDNAIAIIANLLNPNVEQRIATILLRKAQVQVSGPAQPLIISGLTQAQLGEMANAARDVVNRTLKHWEKQGWIEVTYKKIAIIRPSELEILTKLLP